jgi:Mn-dependent DtxR family transcriptional regulator
MNMYHTQLAIRDARSLLTVPNLKTEALAKTYLFIYLYVNCYQYAPTYEEIARHFKITNEAATKRVVRLKRLGYVRTIFGKHRGIVLTALEAA